MKFALSLSGKLRRAGATSAFTLDSGAHEERSVAVTMEAFDCVLEIVPDGDDRLVAPLSMRGLLFAGDLRSLASDAGGVSVQPMEKAATPGEGLRRKARREGQADDVASGGVGRQRRGGRQQGAAGPQELPAVGARCSTRSHGSPPQGFEVRAARRGRPWGHFRDRRPGGQPPAGR